MMSKLIQQILILTILFTLCGGFVLIFRRLCVSGSGRTIKRLWIIVMILAVLPLHILPITLPRQTHQQAHFAEWLTVNETALAARLAEQLKVGAENDAVVNPENETSDTVSDRDTVEASREAHDASNANLTTPENRAGQILQKLQGIRLAVWLCGAVGLIAKSQYGKWKWLRGLRRFALPCRSETWIQLLQKSGERVGIKRPIGLFVIDASLPPVSPCIVGWLKPKLYIHTSHLNDPLSVEEIFVHELQHLRGMDAFYKNISCLVMAIHWFNPITYLIWPRLLEDCELSCDRRTLDVLGEERRSSYMKTILNIAATTTTPQRARHAAMHFCEPSGKQTLKRRYRNMSNKRLQPVVRMMTIFLAAIMVFACVSCQLIGKKKSTLHLLTPLTEEMVRFYYDLSPEDEITQEMLNGVTSLHVYRDMTVVDAVRRADFEGKINAADELPFKGQRYTIEEIGDFIIVDFEVNYQEKDGESFAAARNQALSATPIGCMNYIHRNYMETVILPKVQSEFEGYVDYHKKLNGEFRYKQFKAYWVLKDYNLLNSERQKKEILIAFPKCDEYPYYIFDPTANTEERMRAYIYYAHAGLLTNRIIDTDKIDPAIFDVFPNLADLKITGLTEIKK